jgi:hypothetical protein
MPLTCNIDSRGKAARLVWGVLVLLTGVALVVLWAWGSGSWPRWAVSVGCAVAGGFGVFEARTGWCVVRAMGIRTPI